MNDLFNFMGEEKDRRKEIMLECLNFVAKKKNPYDSFPEENGYISLFEMLQFMHEIHRKWLIWSI